MDHERYLVVTADDYGIGLATSQGILDLAIHGRISATVLLVNSPCVSAAVAAWQRAGNPRPLGWHPCLTLDAPILSPHRVPSLVDATGQFWKLGKFVSRLLTGRIRPADIEAELRAQLQRFIDLTGHPPTIVNSHHHVQVFSPVGKILEEILSPYKQSTYVRRIRESWKTWWGISGARKKRFFLSFMGRSDARRLNRKGFPGNVWLGGITNPPLLGNPEFFVRWLLQIPGKIVELTCHPGFLDPTLIGRDCTSIDGQLQRRFREWHLLRQSSFDEALREAGLTLVTPSQLSNMLPVLSRTAGVTVPSDAA